jgi:hypothetical protein
MKRVPALAEAKIGPSFAGNARHMRLTIVVQVVTGFVLAMVLAFGGSFIAPRHSIPTISPR